MQNSEKIILSIEAAIGKGSVSIRKNGEVITASPEGGAVSRAEELLVSISDLLAAEGIDRTQIDLIAVSTGPGSYTGLRIGIATAIGLKHSLDADVIGISVLEALAIKPQIEGNILSAVRFGSSDIAWQIFERSGAALVAAGEPMADSESAFLEFADSNQFEAIAISPELRTLSEMPGQNWIEIIPSEALATAAAAGAGTFDLQLLYLRKAGLAAL